MSPDPEISRQLYVAFNNNDADEFYRLLSAHPEFLRNEDGTDRWMWEAGMGGKLGILKRLVALGLDVNESKDPKEAESPDNPFFTPEGPIAQAAAQGQLEVVRWLLDQGAKVNHIVNGKQRSMPLLFASTNGHLEIVKLLVEHGADIHAIWQNNNAATLAEEYGHFAIRDFLRAHGGRTLAEITPADYANAYKRFLKHMTERCGPISDFLVEFPGDPFVRLRLIPENKKQDHQTLFTVGLSDHRLPQGQRDYACTELRCMLARDWPMTISALNDVRWNWPLEWLKRLIAELRQANHLPEPAIFMNGDPPGPLAPGTALSGWLCLKDLEGSVGASDHRWIDIHSLFPIYFEEAALVREMGHEELVRRFEAMKIPLHIDPQRANVAIERK